MSAAAKPWVNCKVRSDVERFITAAINVLLRFHEHVLCDDLYAFRVHWSIAPRFSDHGSTAWHYQFRYWQTHEEEDAKTIVAETTALAGSTTESLRNIELVKSLGLAHQEVVQLNGITDKILKLELKKVKYLRSLSFIQGTINALRTSILFLMLYLIFPRRKSRFGQFFSLMIYSFYIFGPLQSGSGRDLSNWRCCVVPSRVLLWTRGQMRVLFVGSLVDGDVPTLAAGVFAVGADAAESVRVWGKSGLHRADSRSWQRCDASRLRFDVSC